MNTATPRLAQLPVFADTPRRLGVSADQLSRLYRARPAFRPLWDDYVLGQLGLKYWIASDDPDAEARRVEYIQTMSELEMEIRSHLKHAWDVTREASPPPTPGTPSEVLGLLRREHGLPGPTVYLAPLLPLIEIAWLERNPSASTITFLETCGEFLSRRLRSLAGGVEVIPRRYLLAFAERFLHTERRPPELQTLASLGCAYLAGHSDPQLVQERERLLWRCAYQVAHSNADGRPNWAQWYRLLDLLPPHTNWRDSEVLARTPLPTLLADLEHASVNG
ncbi:hypothetical protein GCM10025771_42360 [Niveibacterium umoris]